MIRKSARLRAAEVRALIKEGRSVRLGGISAKYLSVGGRGRSAVVVPKAFAKTSVERNRIRRATYRALQTCMPHDIQAVFFVKEKEIKVLNITLISLCSKLT